jgi:hypothetical protein
MTIRKQTRAVATLTVLALCALASAVRTQGGQAQAPPAGRGCNLPEPFPCPVARIMELTIEPATIDPGQSARITWRAENPTNITLSPGVGRVEARGTIRVSPSATTTYTLRTEGGPNGEVVTRTVALVVRGTQPVAVTETTVPRPIPRMPDGKPDLQGVWFGGPFGLNSGRGGAAGAVSVPTRPIPKAGFESRLKIVNGPYEVGGGCGVRSVPIYFGPAYHFQIVQTPRTVVQLIERMHLYRIFQIGAEHSDDVMNGEKLSFLGDSVARWDGDTLVVDTRGLNEKTAVGTDEGAFTGGFRHSPKLHLVERIRRIDYDTLEIESTLEDPDLFTGPWRLITRHELRPEYSRVAEYICEQSSDFYKPLLEGLAPIPPVGDLPATPPGNGRGSGGSQSQATPNR